MTAFLFEDHRNSRSHSRASNIKPTGQSAKPLEPNQFINLPINKGDQYIIQPINQPVKEINQLPNQLFNYPINQAVIKSTN